jgi:hypothetical protein
MKGKETNEEWTDEYGQHHYDKSEDDLSLSSDDRSLANDILSFWGLDFAFGAEYFLAQHFSLGGEYGLRFYFNSVEQKDSYSDAWDYGSEVEAWKSAISATFRMTYAAISLNYYF